MPKGEILRYRGAPPAGGNADIVQIQTGAAIDETNQQISETNTFAQQLSDTLTQAQQDIDAATSTAQTADENAQAALLAAGNAVKSVVIEYALGTSETTAPTTGWSTTPPERTAGSFIWSRTTTTLGDDSTTTTDPVLVTGNTGPAGDPGDPGPAGRGIASSSVTYQVGSSGTTAPTGTWTTTPGAVSAGQFLWTRTIITYTDNTTTTLYSVGAAGANGAPGATGKGVASVTTYYQLVTAGAAAPAPPTANPPGGSWSLTEPAWVSNTDLYTAQLVVFSDNTFGWSAVSKSSSYTAANTALTAAANASAAANLIRDPAFVTGADQVQNATLNATDANGAGVPGPATTYAKIELNDNWAANTRFSTVAGHTYRIECDVRLASDGTSPADANHADFGLMFWYLTVDGAAANTWKANTKAVLATAAATGWKHASWDWVATADMPIVHPSLRAGGNKYLVANWRVTDVTELVNAKSTASTAVNLAQNVVKASQTDPGHNPDGSPGRVWMQLDANGNVTGIKVSNGSAWTSYLLAADQIIVPSSIGDTLIEDGAVTSPKILAGAIEAEHLAVTQDVTGKTFIGGTFEGQTFIGGEFKTDTGGRRMEIGHNQSGGTDPSNISFWNGISGETPAVIGPWNTGGGTSGNPALAMLSPTQSSYTNVAEIDLIAGAAATTTKKVRGATGWGTEPVAQIGHGNLQVYGDIQTTGRIVQGDDTAGLVPLGMLGGYVAPLSSTYGTPSYCRTGNLVTISGIGVATANISAGTWMFSGLPAPVDGKQHQFSMINGSGLFSVFLQLVSGVWCITTFPAISSGTWLPLDGFNYIAA